MTHYSRHDYMVGWAIISAGWPSGQAASRSPTACVRLSVELFVSSTDHPQRPLEFRVHPEHLADHKRRGAPNDASLNEADLTEAIANDLVLLDPYLATEPTEWRDDLCSMSLGRDFRRSMPRRARRAWRKSSESMCARMRETSCPHSRCIYPVPQSLDISLIQRSDRPKQSTPRLLERKLAEGGSPRSKPVLGR